MKLPENTAIHARYNLVKQLTSTYLDNPGWQDWLQSGNHVLSLQMANGVITDGFHPELSNYWTTLTEGDQYFISTICGFVADQAHLNGLNKTETQATIVSLWQTAQQIVANDEMLSFETLPVSVRALHGAEYILAEDFLSLVRPDSSSKRGYALLSQSPLPL